MERTDYDYTKPDSAYYLRLKQLLRLLSTGWKPLSKRVTYSDERSYGKDVSKRILYFEKGDFKH